MLLACPLLAATAAAQGATARLTQADHPALDLKIGDISQFVDPVLLATPIEEELEEIVVNGRRPEPLPEQRVLPQGLGAYVYAATHPLQAWRVMLPDPNYDIPLRTEDDVREPPGQYRARILDPGRIFD
jgi:hypothetical protein